MSYLGKNQVLESYSRLDFDNASSSEFLLGIFIKFQISMKSFELVTGTANFTKQILRLYVRLLPFNVWQVPYLRNNRNDSWLVLRQNEYISIYYSNNLLIKHQSISVYMQSWGRPSSRIWSKRIISSISLLWLHANVWQACISWRKIISKGALQIWTISEKIWELNGLGLIHNFHTLSYSVHYGLQQFSGFKNSCRCNLL